MEVVSTKLDDCWLIKPEVNYDFRGEYAMTFHKKEFESHFPWFEPIEHDISTSFRGVLRGIHYSPHCWKLNQCVYGSIYYVVVNCDKESSDYGEWEAFTLTDKNRWQIFKHPRYGTGFLVLSDYAIFHYIQSQYYDPFDPDQHTFKWDEFDIYWPTDRPILSRRDYVGEYI